MNLDDAIDKIYPLLSSCVSGSQAHTYWFNQLRDFQNRAAEELGMRLRATRHFNVEDYEKDIAEINKLANKYGISI